MDEKAGETASSKGNSGNSGTTGNTATASGTISAANGYTLIEVESDGGWSYHAPNGDVIEVNADGSWERVGQNGTVEVKSDGSWEQTGQGTIQVPVVPAKPAGATVNPVQPVVPRS